ncbi:MAG: hypothetical protein IT429_21550, partial [Gemmataceae bacterium]|nr:hypothetical protein [Gemmataceae bacterium]
MSVSSTPQLATPEEVLRFLGSARVVALDLETTGLSALTDRVRLLAMHDGRRSIVMDCFAYPLGSVLDALKDKILVIFNAMFDLGFLWQAGLKDLPETVDLYVLAQLCVAGEGEHGFPSLSLASCCYRWLQGMLLDKGCQRSDWSGVLSAEQIEYAHRDVQVMHPLMQALDAEITKSGLQRCADIEMRAVRAFTWLAQSGVPFDVEAWTSLARKAASEVQRLEAQLDAGAPGKGEAGLFGHQEKWNWNSPDQVTEVFERLGFSISTTADAQLALIDDPIAVLLRQHREQAQLVKMYGGNWLAGAMIRDGRVYPGWRQIGAATGRSACAHPNM